VSRINSYKKCCRSETNIVKDERGELFADCHSILDRWRNYFSQLLNVNGVSEVRQAEIHTAKPAMLEPSVYRMRWLLKRLKGTNHQVLITFHHNGLKQDGPFSAP
jgi:hypothetical protein